MGGKNTYAFDLCSDTKKSKIMIRWYFIISEITMQRKKETTTYLFKTLFLFNTQDI